MKKKVLDKNSQLLEIVKNLDQETLNQILALSQATEEKKTEKKRSRKSKGLERRPLEVDEYEKIINLIKTGFTYVENGKTKKFRPHLEIALALTIQANLGLRISDVLQLRVVHFQRESLEIHEKKTNKLQYKKLNSNLKELVQEYAKKEGLKLNDYVIKAADRTIQRVVTIVATHLGLVNIGTHSFRKFYAMHVYNTTKDIELVRELLNHSDLGITQRYLRISQSKIDEVSSAVDFTSTMKDCLEERKDEDND